LKKKKNLLKLHYFVDSFDLIIPYMSQLRRWGSWGNSWRKPGVWLGIISLKLLNAMRLE